MINSSAQWVKSRNILQLQRDKQEIIDKLKSHEVNDNHWAIEVFIHIVREFKNHLAFDSSLKLIRDVLLSFYQESSDSSKKQKIISQVAEDFLLERSDANGKLVFYYFLGIVLKSDNIKEKCEHISEIVTVLIAKAIKKLPASDSNFFNNHEINSNLFFALLGYQVAKSLKDKESSLAKSALESLKIMHANINFLYDFNPTIFLEKINKNAEQGKLLASSAIIVLTEFLQALHDNKDLTLKEKFQNKILTWINKILEILKSQQVKEILKNKHLWMSATKIIPLYYKIYEGHGFIVKKGSAIKKHLELYQPKKTHFWSSFPELDLTQIFKEFQGLLKEFEKEQGIDIIPTITKWEGIVSQYPKEGIYKELACYIQLFWSSETTEGQIDKAAAILERCREFLAPDVKKSDVNLKKNPWKLINSLRGRVLTYFEVVLQRTINPSDINELYKLRKIFILGGINQSIHPFYKDVVAYTDKVALSNDILPTPLQYKKSKNFNETIFNFLEGFWLQEELNERVVWAFIIYDFIQNNEIHEKIKEQCENYLRIVLNIPKEQKVSVWFKTYVDNNAVLKETLDKHSAKSLFGNSTTKTTENDITNSWVKEYLRKSKPISKLVNIFLHENNPEELKKFILIEYIDGNMMLDELIELLPNTILEEDMKIIYAKKNLPIVTFLIHLQTNVSTETKQALLKTCLAKKYEENEKIDHSINYLLSMIENISNRDLFFEEFIRQYIINNFSIKFALDENLKNNLQHHLTILKTKIYPLAICLKQSYEINHLPNFLLYLLPENDNKRPKGMTIQGVWCVAIYHGLKFGFLLPMENKRIETELIPSIIFSCIVDKKNISISTVPFMDMAVWVELWQHFHRSENNISSSNKKLLNFFNTLFDSGSITNHTEYTELKAMLNKEPIHYLPRNQRLGCQLFFAPNGRIMILDFENGRFQYFSTDIPRPKGLQNWSEFSYDHFGRLYDPPRRNTNVVHAGPLGGGPSLSNGSFSLLFGIIVCLLNDSGHYMPDAYSLLKFTLNYLNYCAIIVFSKSKNDLHDNALHTETFLLLDTLKKFYKINKQLLTSEVTDITPLSTELSFYYNIVSMPIEIEKLKGDEEEPPRAGKNEICIKLKSETEIQCFINGMRKPEIFKKERLCSSEELKSIPEGFSPIMTTHDQGKSKKSQFFIKLNAGKIDFFADNVTTISTINEKDFILPPPECKDFFEIFKQKILQILKETGYICDAERMSIDSETDRKRERFELDKSQELPDYFSENKRIFNVHSLSDQLIKNLKEIKNFINTLIVFLGFLSDYAIIHDRDNFNKIIDNFKKTDFDQYQIIRLLAYLRNNLRDIKQALKPNEIPANSLYTKVIESIIKKIFDISDLLCEANDIENSEFSNLKNLAKTSIVFFPFFAFKNCLEKIYQDMHGMNINISINPLGCNEAYFLQLKGILIASRYNGRIDRLFTVMEDLKDSIKSDLNLYHLKFILHYVFWKLINERGLDVLDNPLMKSWEMIISNKNSNLEVIKNQIIEILNANQPKTNDDKAFFDGKKHILNDAKVYLIDGIEQLIILSEHNSLNEFLSRLKGETNNSTNSNSTSQSFNPKE